MADTKRVVVRQEGKSALVEALAQIAGRPVAAFSRDRLTHANNTIMEMQRIAADALSSDDADSVNDEPYRRLIGAALAYADSYDVYIRTFERNGDGTRYIGLADGAAPTPLHPETDTACKVNCEKERELMLAARALRELVL